MSELRERFRALTDRWYDETGGLSNPSTILAHPSVSEILAMGKDVLPLIFEEYAREPHLEWAVILRRILGEHPTFPPDSAGRVSMIRDAWLAWGRERGYVTTA